MRGWAITLLLVATVLMLVFTSFGASPGVNKFRYASELLILAAALGAIALTARNPITRLVGAVVLVAGISLLGLLVLPVADPVRKSALTPFLSGEERGFVLAALGRPDFLGEGGIGTARIYSYRSSVRPGQLLVVRFRASQDTRDQVERAEWLDESEAQRTYDLQPPGYPGFPP